MAARRPQTWHDPSPHLDEYIETERGVKLEVLDWGGTGPAVLLLAGHGDTAHVFDDFAPALTVSFHVLSLTRRGFGASSQPKDGYDLTTMVRDIVQVLDALHLKSVNLVGHSIAGDELTRFALTYPDRVTKLVYLEAAYDRVEAQKLESRFPHIPASSASRELGSPEAIRATVARNEILMPEANIRATRVFGTDGQFVRSVTPDAILHSVAKMVEHPDYRSIRAPMLAVYAVYESPDQLAPRYRAADRETRDALDQVFAMWQAFAKSQRNLFRQSAPGARVIEIPGGSHYVFISDRERVLQEVLAFLQPH
jgi:non-heme chloroperoxidase